MLPYLALPRMGFAVPLLLPETRWALTLQPLARSQHALRHATISPLPVPPLPTKRRLCRRKAAKSERVIGGIFLLHFPSLHSARPLAGILLYGARTFLQIPHFRWHPAAAWRTSRTHCTRWTELARVSVIRSGFVFRRGTGDAKQRQGL